MNYHSNYIRGLTIHRWTITQTAVWYYLSIQRSNQWRLFRTSRSARLNSPPGAMPSSFVRCADMLRSRRWSIPWIIPLWNINKTSWIDSLAYGRYLEHALKFAAIQDLGQAQFFFRQPMILGPPWNLQLCGIWGVDLIFLPILQW